MGPPKINKYDSSDLTIQGPGGLGQVNLNLAKSTWTWPSFKISFAFTTVLNHHLLVPMVTATQVPSSPVPASSTLTYFDRIQPANDTDPIFQPALAKSLSYLYSCQTITYARSLYHSLCLCLHYCTQPLRGCSRGNSYRLVPSPVLAFFDPNLLSQSRPEIIVPHPMSWPAPGKPLSHIYSSDDWCSDLFPQTVSVLTHLHWQMDGWMRWGKAIVTQLCDSFKTLQLAGWCNKSINRHTCRPIHYFHFDSRSI